MPTYTQILYHLILSSKDQQPFLNRKNQNSLYNYIEQILKKKFCRIYIVGGSGNHIHIVFHLHPTESLACLVKDIKETSFFMMKHERHLYSDFTEWQSGYNGFTYHISAKGDLIRYVRNQKKLHKLESYKDEIKRLLKENKVNYNEKFLFR